MNSNTLRIFFKNNLQIILIVAILIAINIATLSFYQGILWDSSVYIGMGKYIYSLGKSGLWEPIRPLTLPFILGLFWKIGLDPLVYGKLLMLLFSIGVIVVTYLLSNKLFSKQTAITASIMISLSPLMLNVSHEILVEVPAVFFLLLCFYFYLENRNYFAGFFLGLAFLTKFPTIFFLFVILGAELLFLFRLSKRYASSRFKIILPLLLAFVMIILPYFIFNYFYYKDALFPLKSAEHVIENAVGCTVSNVKPAYYYAPLVLKDNPLHVFFISGSLFIFFNKKGRYKINKAQILAYLSVFFLYFTLLTCKTDRYPILALPFISIITGYGIASTFVQLIKNKKYQILISILVFIISSFVSLNHIGNGATHRQDIEFFSYPQNHIDGEILTTTPQIAVFTDSRLNPIYYSLYGSGTADYYIQYINHHKGEIAYVLINTDDIPCHPRDLECPKKTQEFIKFLKDNLKLVKYNRTGNREFFIFSPQ